MPRSTIVDPAGVVRGLLPGAAHLRTIRKHPVSRGVRVGPVWVGQEGQRRVMLRVWILPMSLPSFSVKVPMVTMVSISVLVGPPIGLDGTMSARLPAIVPVREAGTDETPFWYA